MNPTILNIKRIPGRLCYAPTNLDLEYPHGGIGLGVIKSIRVQPYKTYYSVTAEEFGGEVVDKVDGGESWVLGATLRAFDKDAISKIFTGATTGTQTQESVIQYPSSTTTIRAGNLLSAIGIKLLFSPDNTKDNPFVIFYNAIPMIEETAEMNFEIDTDWTCGVLFAGIRDSQNRSAIVGYKGDFSL